MKKCPIHKIKMEMMVNEGTGDSFYAHKTNGKWCYGEIKVADFVIDFLIKKKLIDIFYVPGGGISQLMDSCIDREVNPILMRHEQACAFACEGYSRVKGMAVCIVTSGVGSVNALQGMASAYIDKVPFIVISGDMPGIDIVSMARPVTCYATTLLRPSDVSEVLEKSYKMAKLNSQPVLINIPGVVQKADSKDQTFHSNQIQTRKPFNKVSTDGMTNGKYVNPYLFMKKLADSLDKDTILVGGNSTDTITALQLGIKIVHNYNYGAMGFDLPAAIGVAIATKKKVILITGDGSIMCNIQELETIHRLKLPIKIYVFDNDGYASMRRSEMRDYGRISGGGKLAMKFRDKLITYVKIDPNLIRH